jgi:hypothetical protein
MVVNITPGAIIESTIIYGIVHGIWSCIKVCLKKAEDEARRERNRIIKHHVKTGHSSRFKHCLDGNCSSLQNLGLPEQQGLQELQAGAES